MSTQNKRVWITGASSGIGRQLAVDYEQKGHTVYASARNAQALESLAEEYSGVIALACDVTQLDSLQTAVSTIETTGALDLVIANAGICHYMDGGEIKPELAAEVMNINYLGVINTLSSAVGLLQKQHQHTGQKSQVAVVSSLASYVPLTRAEYYGASKAALTYFAEVLQLDWKHWADVSIINPGFIDTPMTQVNDFPMPFLSTTEKVSEAIIDGLNRRKPLIVYPKKLGVLLSLARLSKPTWQKLSYRAQLKSFIKK